MIGSDGMNLSTVGVPPQGIPIRAPFGTHGHVLARLCPDPQDYNAGGRRQKR